MVMSALLTMKSSSQNIVKGIVIDSISRSPVAYAAVIASGSEAGTLTDDNGAFTLKTTLRPSIIKVSAMGYTTKEIELPTDINKSVHVELLPTGVKLSEVTIKPRKEKYSKKNNPAVAFMEKIRAGANLTDPRRNANYNYDKYERITLALDDFNGGSPDDPNSGNAIVRKFPMLKEHMDTSALTGRTILNIAMREKASHVSYRLDPKSEREIIAGIRREGIDQMLDPQATQTLYEDVLREVDIYNNDITLMQNRFVSPLSRIAPDFYKFYLADTVTVGIDTCVVLSFAPHNPRAFGFVGRLYVPKNDSTRWVKRIEMNAPRDINLNFINNLRIIQEYEKASDGSRLKKIDDMIVEAGLLSSGSQIYSRRVTAYGNHNFNPAPDIDVFKSQGKTITLRNAEHRDSTWWDSSRLVHISSGENSVGHMLERLRKIPLYYWSEKVLRILVTGYINTSKQSKYDIGPVNTMLSFNDLEGTRLKVGGMSTANLSPRFFTKQWVAWGTKDHKWKYYGEVEWSFRDKAYHSREFPIHSLRLTHFYDVDMLGQHFLFTNPDNIFLSLRRAKDRMMAYQQVSKLDYILELENNFSVQATLKHVRREDSPFISYVDGYGKSFGHYDMSSVTLSLRYAPGEKFFQTKTGRLPVNLDAPVVQLTHTFAPKGIFGNRFSLNVTELSFQKRWWLSAFGYVDMIVRGGHVWSKSPFPDLLIPNANLSYTIQPESFALMNPVEFVNDSYASWDLTYWANGAIFNYVPLLKKLKLREVFSFRGVWGHLSDRNNPGMQPELFRFPNAGSVAMSSTPYMEAGVGIDNIFRILRLDYVWRLTYRSTPGCDRSGLRLALHFTF